MKAKKITQDEVRIALEHFKRDGGLIRRLPDQVTPSRAQVPTRAGYETVDLFLTKVGLLP